MLKYVEDYNIEKTIESLSLKYTPHINLCKLQRYLYMEFCDNI